jgi:hypothetical protein
MRAVDCMGKIEAQYFTDWFTLMLLNDAVSTEGIILLNTYEMGSRVSSGSIVSD